MSSIDVDYEILQKKINCILRDKFFVFYCNAEIHELLIYEYLFL